MEKHTELVKRGQATDSGPGYITCYKGGHFLHKAQRRSGWTSKFNTCPHMGRIGEQAEFGRHIFSSFAEGCSNFIIAHGGLINDESSVIFLTLSKLQGGHCWLPDEAHGGQHYQQSTKQHVITDISEDCRAQNDLEERQQPVTAGPEPSVHRFNGMSVVNIKIQLMSGHNFFLSLLACPPVGSEEVAPVIWVSGQSHHHSASRTGRLVQMGWSYSLLLRGDCFSAVTVAWGESLPQTGRGPALRAPFFKAGYHITSWVEAEEVVVILARGYHQQRQLSTVVGAYVLLAELVFAVAYSFALFPQNLSNSITFLVVVVVVAVLLKFVPFYSLHQAVSDLWRDCPCCFGSVLASAFYQTWPSTNPIGVSRSNKLTRPYGTHQLLPRATACSLTKITESLAVIRQAWDGQLYHGLKALCSPLAVSLHDRVHMACFAIQQVAYHTGTTLTMKEALARTQPPASPCTQQRGQRRSGGRHA